MTQATTDRLRALFVALDIDAFHLSALRELAEYGDDGVDIASKLTIFAVRLWSLDRSCKGLVSGFDYKQDPDGVRAKVTPLGELVLHLSETLTTPAPDVVALVETWNKIEQMVEGEGNTLTIACENPEGEGPNNHAVDVCADWTDWKETRFYAPTRFEAIGKALATFKETSDDT